MASFMTSGDLSADRRLDWALASAREGDHAGAADLSQQAIEIAPHFSAAWFTLAEAKEALGDQGAAREAYARCLELAPKDALGAGPRLARLDGDNPGALPGAYVKGLFDDYAARFDQHLTQGLGYRGPALLREAVLARGARRFRRALDLGCGTGLSGEAFADLCETLVGCDLSGAMLAQARAKGLYARLEEAELGAFLAACAPGENDLVVAADVFVYLGALDGVLASSARTLEPGGLIAFTTQAIEEGAAFRLLDDLRFGHSKAGLETALAQAGFVETQIFAASTRRDRGVDVPGYIASARKA
jgi:predicted TPR repeat methyltransferase